VDGGWRGVSRDSLPLLWGVGCRRGRSQDCPSRRLLPPSRSWEHGGASRVRVSSCGGGGCLETGATRSRKRFLPPLCSSRGGRRYRADASLDGRGRRWTVVGGGSRDSLPPLLGVACRREPSRGLLPPSPSWEHGGARVAVWRGVPRDRGDPVSKASPSASLRFSVWGETPGRCVLGWARAAVREGVCASDVPVAGLPVSPSRSRERNAVRRAAVSVCRRRPRSGAWTGVGGRGETLAAVGSRSVVPWVRSGGVLAEPRSVGGGAEGDGAS